jgi:predicted nucleic acid-binding protein
VAEGRTICSDNSIWVRVLVDLDEILVDEAFSWMNSSVLLVAPDLLHYEFSHVLTRYVRNRKVTPAHAGQLLDALLALKIDLVDDDELHRQSLALSMSNPGLSGYDAQYLAVSERSGAELWTADKGLAAISQGLGLSTRLWITAPSA